jgi:hypothetical protein
LIAVTAVGVRDHREKIAASYGQLAARRCSPARSVDLLIAATAHAHSARLYTRNAEDFHGIEGSVDIVAA